MISRHTFPAILVQKFTKDYQEVMNGYNMEQQIELTKHLIIGLEAIKEYHQTKNDTLYKEWQRQEKQLLEKYKSSLKVYKAKSFYRYFQFEIVLAEKDLYTAEEFNKVPSEEQSLSDAEIRTFLDSCLNLLNNSLERLYLQSTSESILTDVKSLPGENPTGELVDKEITRSRQMLAIYYLLKSGFGIEHRKSNNISDVAKFVHLMTGTKFNSLTTSEIYKRYKAVPNNKEGAELLKDLKYIRPYFESLQIEEALKLIDADIDAALKEIPFADRKTYR